VIKVAVAGADTPGDVCALFKVTKYWVYDEVEAGRLPNVKLGRKHVRFCRRELESYLDEHLRRPRLDQRPAGPGRHPRQEAGRLPIDGLR
jgi:excisionase family DNA binding protein